MSPKETNEVMLGFGKHKASLPNLAAPRSFSMTVADVADYAGGAGHADRVLEWANAVWKDWSDQHEFVRAWIKASSVLNGGQRSS
jgi:hypothetical protein